MSEVERHTHTHPEIDNGGLNGDHNHKTKQSVGIAIHSLVNYKCFIFLFRNPFEKRQRKPVYKCFIFLRIKF